MSVPLNYKPVPFDDTYILYNPEDILSLLSVLFTLLPIAILVFYLSWFMVTREVEPCLMALGQVINDIVNNIVKNKLKQERPMKIEGFQENGIRSGYGMPSAHSQFMGFFTTYLILRIWLQWRDLTTTRKWCSSVGLVVLAGSVASSRVYLYYHSWEQVVIGVLIGSVVGALHFFLVSLLRAYGKIDSLVNWSFARWFWMKDSVYWEPLTLRQEYENWQTRRDCKKSK